MVSDDFSRLFIGEAQSLSPHPGGRSQHVSVGPYCLGWHPLRAHCTGLPDQSVVKHGDWCGGTPIRIGLARKNIPFVQSTLRGGANVGPQTGGPVSTHHGPRKSHAPAYTGVRFLPNPGLRFGNCTVGRH